MAARGGLSAEQLNQVVKVAEPDNDHHWAAEAPSWSPVDLAHEARVKNTPTMAEAAARRAARRVGLWWGDTGMLMVNGEVPDLDGALVESVFNRAADRITPPKGQPWEPRARRYADVLVELCRNYAHVEAVSGPAPVLIVQVPLEGPATVAGIPLPDAMVEALRADATIEPLLVDAEGGTLAVGRRDAVLSEKHKRVVKQRDGKCRWPGCDRRVGLHVHHLRPRSWGGTDEPSNLATVCTAHHAELAPQGAILLLGNPNHPAGLSLLHRADLPALAQLAGQPARAGSEAA